MYPVADKITPFPPEPADNRVAGRRHREIKMAKYIQLLNWTDQGIKSVKDSPKRLDAAREAAKKMGITILKFYMTAGAHDMVVIADAPDSETMAKFTLMLGMGGNLRSTTMKAFSEDAYRRIMGSL